MELVDQLGELDVKVKFQRLGDHIDVHRVFQRLVGAQSVSHVRNQHLVEIILLYRLNADTVLVFRMDSEVSLVYYSANLLDLHRV